MVLDQILAYKREEIQALKAKRTPQAVEQAAKKDQEPRRSLTAAITKPGAVNFICELKKASPSGGVLRPDFNPVALATEFEAVGASALSILTESKYFQGSSETPAKVRPLTTIPLLRKDFIIEPYQVYETVLLKADALLLIVAILTDAQLKQFIKLAHSLLLDVLVEVHTAPELDRALNAGANLIGINSRNLTTLEVDTKVPEKLFEKVPRGIPVVIESGIQSASDVIHCRQLGACTFLVGTAFMKSRSISDKFNELRSA